VEPLEHINNRSTSLNSHFYYDKLLSSDEEPVEGLDDDSVQYMAGMLAAKTQEENQSIPPFIHRES
jgi:hypothetical protein